MDMNPKEFAQVLAGREKAVEEDFRRSWETTRSICYSGALPNFKKNNVPKITKFMPLAWDKKDDSAPMTIDEFYELSQKWQVNPQ